MGIASLTKSAELLSPRLHRLTEEEIRRLQEMLLQMAADIAAVCREQNVRWILTGGSALGALRHGGIIPWDDDIDLAMFRGDFEKFKAVFPGKLADKYELKLPGDPGYLYPFPKICRKNTTVQSIQSEPDTNEMVSVDIFIMENVSDSKLARTVHGLKCTALLAILSAMRMKRCKKTLLDYGACSKELCAAVKKRAAFAGLFSFFSLELWLKKADRVFSGCKNSQSQYIVIPTGNGHFFGELFLREKMEAGAAVDFGGVEAFLAKDADYYLRLRYGADYAQIPGENERERHAFIRFDLER